jgi:CheY-like chemotaxis protein
VSVRILLVDDNASFRCTLSALLELAGHVVAEAASMTDARARLANAAFDLALLDVHLGDGSGPELIGDVRRACPAARVIILSGGSADPSVQRADLVLEKGDDPEEMLRRIRMGS